MNARRKLAHTGGRRRREWVRHYDVIRLIASSAKCEMCDADVKIHKDCSECFTAGSSVHQRFTYFNGNCKSDIVKVFQSLFSWFSSLWTSSEQNHLPSTRTIKPPLPLRKKWKFLTRAMHQTPRDRFLIFFLSCFFFLGASSCGPLPFTDRFLSLWQRKIKIKQWLHSNTKTHKNKPRSHQSKFSRKTFTLYD